jgi:WD40 repeat protein/serine/threonine protein kinase
MADWIGQRIGAYEITDLLGAGGMAQVYRARQLSIKREVAIKIIGARLAESPEFLKRFEREANTAANLNHAHIVKIFDYGEYNDSLYLVMELLSGGSLADRMRNTPMSLDTVARIVEQVGSALDYAHLKGIIHRDLKPQNVLFDESGDAHLSDFGIAKVLTENTSLTQSGAIIGTPTYMSPEQYRAEVLDGRSDLYSFGVMLFEMLTGQAPFKADTPVVMAIMHLQNPPPKARSLRPDLPVAVEAVLETALAKDPDKRFQSAGALATAFRAAITVTPPAKTPVPPDVETSVIKPAPLAEPSQTRASKPTPIPSGGNRRLLVAGVAGVIVVAALLVTVLSKLAGTPTSPTLVPGTVPPVIALNPTATETRTVIIPTNTIQVVVRASATTPSITPTETNTRTVTATAVPPTTAPSITPLPPTSTIAPSLSKVPTTIDPSMLIAATINGRLTQTAITILSYTPTPTLTPSNTPNIEQTVAAGVQMTDTAGTAIAVASFTKTPTLTLTPLLSSTLSINASNATNLKQLASFSRGTVNQSIWSPDGKIMALAGGIGVWLYNANDLTQQPSLLQGHTAVVRTVAFSSDGSLLASGGDDSSVILWDVNSRKLLRTIVDKTTVNSVAFSPDGKTVASGGNDNTIRLWNSSSGVLISTLYGHSAAVISVAFSPDGKILASASLDRNVKLWDVGGRMLINTLSGHTDFVFSVAFSPDGKTLASGSYDHTVRLWAVSSAKLLNTLPASPDTSFVSGVAFSPDGTILASGSGDPTGGGNSGVRLWNVGSGSLIRTLSATSFVWSVAFSPDGKTLTSSSSEGTVWLWNVGSGKLINTLSDHIAEVNSVAYSPDGKTILSGSKDGVVRLWDTSNGNVIRNLYGNTNWVDSVAYAPDGKTVASDGNDAVVRVWDTRDGSLLYTLPGHKSAAWGLAYSPDSKILASGSYDNTIRLWDTSNGTLIRTIIGHTNHVWSVDFSPDGKTLVSGSEDQTVRLWDVGSGVLIRTLSGHTGNVKCVVFSPDNKIIASSSDDQTIRLWDASSGALLRMLPVSPHWMNTVAFSPDGKTLVSGSTSEWIHLWDVSSGKLLTTLYGHMSLVWSIAFSPDGRTIVSGGLDGTIRLWGDSSLAATFAPVALAPTAMDTSTATIASTATGIPIATMTPVPVSSIVPGHVTAVYVDDFDGNTLSDYWSVDSNQHTFSNGVLSFDVNEKVSGKMDGLFRPGFAENDGFLIVFRYPAATPIGSIGVLGSKTSGIEAWALNMRASVVQSRTDDYFTSLRNPSFTANVWYSMLVYIDQDRTFYTYIWKRDNPSQYLVTVNAKPPWTSPSWAFLLNEEGGKLDITHFEQLRFPSGFVMPDKPLG